MCVCVCVCLFVSAIVGVDDPWRPEIESLVARVVSGWCEGTALRSAFVVEHRRLCVRVGFFPTEAKGELLFL